jgi:serine/threonine protein kinase
MNCEFFRPLLPADTDDLLESEEAHDLHRHLAECQSCRNERDELADAFTQVVRRPSAPAPEVWDRLLTSIGAELSEDPTRDDVVDLVATRLVLSKHEVRERRRKHSWLGKRVGPCVLLELLGQGAVGAVYRAYHSDYDVDVAVKVMDKRFLGSARVLDRMRREYEETSKISHPNVVRVFPCIECEDGTFATVSELVYGQELGDEIARKGKCAPAEAAAILLAIAKAVRAGHQEGVLHREISPGAVLVGPKGEIKLMDFVPERPRENDEMHLTRCGAMMRSPRYLSPEQCQNKPIDERTDLYGLGGVFYLLLTGRPPFHGSESVMEVFADKINGNGLHEPTEFAPDLPEDYQRVLAGLLARYPEERYADADALIEDLEALQRGWPVQAREPFPKLTRRSETQEPGSGASCFTSLLLLVAGAVALILWVTAS